MLGFFKDDTEYFPKPIGKLSKSFIFPPFSVLNARDGVWQARKNTWKGLGIESEIGRDGAVYNTTDWVKEKGIVGNCQTGGIATGTSIFDPVLTELMYEWFCMPKGQIVDPFAGGSVRGIVASFLGFKYWGCDLRQEQIHANNKQAFDILLNGKTMPVRISGKMLRQAFHGCTKDFIENVCQGRCCESAKGIKVIVHPYEEDKIRKLGCKIKDGYIIPDEREKCPFKGDNGLCKIHENKPLGCKASPFTFNDHGLLIVRNRYRLLKCFKHDGAKPAYVSFRWSLEQIFGKNQTKMICDAAENGVDNITAKMDMKIAQILLDNHVSRNASTSNLNLNLPKWVCGDTLKEIKSAPNADFIFSCPPYGNLEKYSDDPKDLSNMEYGKFLRFYRKIIIRTCAKLKNDRFACFVVGDFRDKSGNMNSFVYDTIKIFNECGLHKYNEFILTTSVGSAPIRANKQFIKSRKACKVHQNVLVFVKGDINNAVKSINQ